MTSPRLSGRSTPSVSAASTSSSRWNSNSSVPFDQYFRKIWIMIGTYWADLSAFFAIDFPSIHHKYLFFAATQNSGKTHLHLLRDSLFFDFVLFSFSCAALAITLSNGNRNAEIVRSFGHIQLQENGVAERHSRARALRFGDQSSQNLIRN